CDELKIDGGIRPPEELRLSFSDAPKMRAAASWNFAQVRNQGNIPWRKEQGGVWVGNPSVSVFVSSYMVSLKRRKVR
ncbi:hypothetical protein C8R46DRAFT_808668, partial [Mycena filopes]